MVRPATRTFLAVVLAACAALVGVPLAQAAPVAATSDAAPAPEVPSAAQIRAEVAPGEQVELGVVRADEVSGELHVDTVSVVGPQETAAQVRELAADPDTVAVGLPQLVRATADATAATIDYFRPVTAARPWPYNQWALDLLCADAASRQQTEFPCPDQAGAYADGSGQVVAVIDTAVDVNHPDLAGAMVTGAKCFGAPCVMGTPTIADFLGRHGVVEHGTHVAGIVAATAGNGIGIAGVAPAARVMPMMVLDGNGEGYTIDIAAAVLWAVDNGATVINMSLSTTQANAYDPVLAAAVAYATDLGVPVVAAAGNDGLGDNNVPYPAALPGVIGVGNVNPGREVDMTSGHGAWVDVVAPGDMVVSTLPGNRYGYLSGTSMAAPHVAATVALVQQRRGVGLGSRAEGILTGTAIDAGPAGRDDRYGYGIVSPVAALRSGGAVPSAPGAGSTFVPVAAARVFNSQLGTPIAARRARGVAVTTEVGSGRAVVPAGATAVAYNLTVVDPPNAGHLRVMPGDTAASAASAVNFASRQNIANGLVTRLDGQGRLRLFNGSGAPVHAMIDVVGYFLPGAGLGFTPTPPSRVYDSREAGAGDVASGQTREMSVARDLDGREIVPAGAGAVAYNITVVSPRVAGHLRVMPGDVETTPTSAINWTVPGERIANGLVTKVSADRTIKVLNASSAPVTVLVDIVGYYAAGSGAQFFPIAPARAYDSRTSQPPSGAVSGALVPGGERRITVAATVPTDATAIAYNVTTPLAAGNPGGHLRVWPSGEARPNASVLNWPTGGATRANATVVGLGSGRSVDVYNGSPAGADVVVDVLGYYR